MIKQLVITFYLLFSLLLFSACTIFDSGDYEEDLEEEDYYLEEGEEGEGEEGEGELVSDQELEAVDEPEDLLEEEASDTGMYDDIQYIDEEDEDLLAEEGEEIEVEEDPLDREAEISSAEAETSESVETAYDDGSESSSFFQPDAKTSSRPSVPVKKQWISYKKIKSQPYNVGGFLINAVYIARQGEDIQNVSNKIFGSDQVSQLYAINPHLKARNLKVGDKIYYQSPNRPQDSSQLLFYFEDNGISPSYHQIQDGENIRTVASQLLGHANSWKEIWATNPDLESKGVVKAPLNIKYWPLGTAVQQMPEPVEETPTPPTVADTDTLPSPPTEEEATITDEEPTTAENIPTPPPDEDELMESPSSAPTEEMKKPPSGFSQMDMILAGILALGALICSFIIMKKRRKKKEFDYTAANFEIDE